MPQHGRPVAAGLPRRSKRTGQWHLGPSMRARRAPAGTAGTTTCARSLRERVSKQEPLNQFRAIICEPTLRKRPSSDAALKPNPA